MPSELCVPKVKFPKQNGSFVIIILSTQTIDCNLFNELIKQCSSLLKLKRIVAWLLRYKQNVLGVIRGSATTNRNKLLPVTELENAELELVELTFHLLRLALHLKSIFNTYHALLKDYA